MNISNENSHDKSLAWLIKENFKTETIAAKNDATNFNYGKERIDKTQLNSKRRLRGDRTETN